MKPMKPEVRKLLLDKYTTMLQRWVTDFGEPSTLGRFYLSTDFHMFTSESCYAIHDKLVAHKLITKGVKHDHEHSCCYYYFRTRKAANTFCAKLAEFMVKRFEVAAHYMLNLNEFAHEFDDILLDNAKQM